MAAVVTRRLRLEPITPEAAARIVARDPADGDLWHPEYPLVDEFDVLRPHAVAVAPHPVFAPHVVRTRVDGVAIGGIGFAGPPDAQGVVELGYGLVAGVRGHGYATEAVLGMLEVALLAGAKRVVAETRADNVPSRMVLLKSGFTPIGPVDEPIVRYEHALT